jgi:ribosome-interacting GTPase 1
MFPWFVPYHFYYAPLRPQVTVLNKIDAISIQELDLLYKIPNSVPISSKEWLNIDELLEMMWDKLDLVRV